MNKQASPKLLPAGNNPLVAAAKNIRLLVGFHFPRTAFKVHSSRYSMGNNINVSWTNGPTSEMVQEILPDFESGSFDGMTDYYNYNGEPHPFGETKYLSLNRHLTEEAEALPLEHFKITPERYEGMDWNERQNWKSDFFGWINKTDLTFFDSLQAMG